MRYSKKPKYKLDKTKIDIPQKKKVSPEDIYKEMLMDKIRKGKRR